MLILYRAPSNKIVDKVFIPQEEHPDINFVGLLIGPRGNTLKMLEKDVRDQYKSFFQLNFDFFCLRQMQRL